MATCLQEDPAKALSDAERLKRQRMEEQESERAQRLLLEQVWSALEEGSVYVHVYDMCMSMCMFMCMCMA